MANITLKSKIPILIKYTILVFTLFIFFLPILSMFIVSITPEDKIFSLSKGIFPENPKWSNYSFALTYIPFFRYLLNTLVISVLYTIACTFSSAMAGYAFARFRIKENEMIFKVVLSSIMIPYIITIIPFYLLIKNLALNNSFMLWFFYGLAGAPFMIYLYRQFFLTIPRSFEESALLDGANQWHIFIRIMLPLVKSGTVICGMFSFLWTWQNYIMPVLFLSGKKQSLAVRLTGAYVDVQQRILYGPLMSGIVYYILVPMVIFFIFKRQIMSGMLDGGIKG